MIEHLKTKVKWLRWFYISHNPFALRCSIISSSSMRPFCSMSASMSSIRAMASSSLIGPHPAGILSHSKSSSKLSPSIFFCHDVIRTLLIHHINRIAFEECLDVGGYLLVQALASLVGGPGNVRGEVGIRLVPERIVL